MTKSRKLILVFLILNILLIWSNSILSPDVSNKLSDPIVTAAENKVAPSKPSVIESRAEATGGDVSEATAIVKSKPPSQRKVTEQPSYFGHTMVYWIRKGAHLAEFACLGLLALLLFQSVGIASALKNSALTALSVALIDETIQIFTGRTATIRDIWIDLLGFALGAGVALLIRHFIQRSRKTIA